MNNYYTLGVGSFALGSDYEGITQGWLSVVKPGANISEGHGNDVDAMRHGGTAALAAYRLGYQRAIALGKAVEDQYPGPVNEARQDLFNNVMGASIGYIGKILGLNEEKVGTLVQKAYVDRAFLLSASDILTSKSIPISKLDIGNGFSILSNGRLSLPDGKIVDLDKSYLLDSPRVSGAKIAFIDEKGVLHISFMAKREWGVVRNSLIKENSVFNQRCFTGGTLILMSDGSEAAIETIRPGDMVASFDEGADGGRGALVPKRVVRTFVNENQVVIDFHGTKVTPGHAYLCGDGPHEGRFKQIMTIVRDDGAVVLADGTRMRAATGCAVGSAGDAFVELQIARPARNRLTGESVILLKERGRIRAGTRVQRPDGSFFSVLDLIRANGWTLQETGLVGQGPGHAPEPLLWAGRTIPKPQDYILALSRLTLADLYDDPRPVEAPEASPVAWRQGEATAVVLAAADRSSGDGREGRGAKLSLGHRVRDTVASKRPQKGRVPREAGEIVH